MASRPLSDGKQVRSNEERITILVVDDDGLFRQFVVAILGRDKQISVVGQAKNAEEGLRLARRLLPDVVLLDLDMPTGEGRDRRGGRAGIEAAAALSREVPTARILMLTASERDDDVHEALLAGADGYLLKADLLDELARVVRTMADGVGMLLSPTIAARVVTQFRASPPSVAAPDLSAREVEVLHLVGLGKTNDQIAGELFLSSHTVKRHVANILRKLNQHSRADAVRYAARKDAAPDASGGLTDVVGVEPGGRVLDQDDGATAEGG